MNDHRAATIAAIHTWPLRIYYEDTDAAGVVYYANYLKFAERARTEALFAAGVEQIRLRDEDDVVFAVRVCNAEYLRPARLGDMVAVETAIEKIGGASIVLRQNVVKDGVNLVVMQITLVCMHGDGRATRIPQQVRAVLQSMAETTKED
jgi:acyl-CoA thioester hydrolase